MQQLRIGLVGAGFIGGTHSIMLRQIADALGEERVRLEAVADPDPEARRRFAEHFRYARTFADDDSLLREADINTLFVCTPTRHHAALVEKAAARGLHLFCEKPLAMSLAEARRMAAQVSAAGIHTQIGLVLRYSAVYTHMDHLIRRPEMGTPMAVVFRDDQCFPIRGVHNSTWRADRSLTAGGTMIEHGVHDIDLMTWMFGPIARLRAWEQNRAGHPGVEDYMAVEIEFASGLRAQLMNLWHNIVSRPSNRRLEVFCENGFVASDHDMVGPVLRQVGAGEEELVTADEVVRHFVATLGRGDHPLSNWFAVGYMLQDLSFVEALLEDRPPAPDLRAGVEAQRLVEAIYHSARSGEDVEVAQFC